MYIGIDISYQKEGAVCAAYATGVTSICMGPKIFQFNEFAGAIGLKKPRQPAEGTDLSKENLASLSPLSLHLPLLLKIFMSLFRTSKVTETAERPSALIEIRMVDKLGLPLDPSAAWAALQLAFKDHPHLEVKSAKIYPDKEGPSVE